MRQREKQRLNEQAATLVMGWEKDGNDWMEKNGKKMVWAGYMVARKEGEILPPFNPVEDLNHAWLLVERFQGGKPGYKGMRVRPEVIREVFDIDIFGLRTKEAACRITQNAVNMVLKLQRVAVKLRAEGFGSPERSSTKTLLTKPPTAL